MNYFTELNSVDVSRFIEEKNGLSYVSWANAWSELKKRHPTAQYKVYERDTENGPVNYFTDGKTAWVKTSVAVDMNDGRVDGEPNYLAHVEYLPVMDFKNKSIPLENITSMDVNKAIQRSLTKCVARHGIGLYVYAGEDLPVSEPSHCECCERDFTVYPQGYTKSKWESGCKEHYGVVLCQVCAAAEKAKRSKEAGKEVD